MLRLEAKLQRVEVVHSGPELDAVYAQLRADCEAAGHPLDQTAHTAARWIAATAIRLGSLCRTFGHEVFTFGRVQVFWRESRALTTG